MIDIYSKFEFEFLRLLFKITHKYKIFFLNSQLLHNHIIVISCTCSDAFGFLTTFFFSPTLAFSCSRAASVISKSTALTVSGFCWLASISVDTSAALLDPFRSVTFFDFLVDEASSFGGSEIVDGCSSLLVTDGSGSKIHKINHYHLWNGIFYYYNCSGNR